MRATVGIRMGFRDVDDMADGNSKAGPAEKSGNGPINIFLEIAAIFELGAVFITYIFFYIIIFIIAICLIMYLFSPSLFSRGGIADFLEPVGVFAAAGVLLALYFLIYYKPRGFTKRLHNCFFSMSYLAFYAASIAGVSQSARSIITELEQFATAAGTGIFSMILIFGIPIFLMFSLYYFLYPIFGRHKISKKLIPYVIIPVTILAGLALIPAIMYGFPGLATGSFLINAFFGTLAVPHILYLLVKDIEIPDEWYALLHAGSRL
jgi:hypothetical protein